MLRVLRVVWVSRPAAWQTQQCNSTCRYGMQSAGSCRCILTGWLVSSSIHHHLPPQLALLLVLLVLLLVVVG